MDEGDGENKTEDDLETKDDLEADCVDNLRDRYVASVANQRIFQRRSESPFFLLAKKMSPK